MSRRVLAASVLMFAAGLPTAFAQQQTEDAKNALRAQADRALVIYKRGKTAHYKDTFDLSGMPHYEPKQLYTGWIRLHGNNYLADGMLGEYWQQGFAKFQPGIRFSNFLPTSAVAFAALYYNQADIVRDGKYLPLTTEVVREQLKKLDQ